MSMICAGCDDGQLLGDEVTMCPECFGPLEHFTSSEPPRPTEAPVPEEERPTDELRCWNCGDSVPDPGNIECLNPSCRRSLTPPALLLRFPRGSVELGPGELRPLGRLGEFRWVFRDNANVSRMHALVGVERSGSAWIEPLPTPNGTWLDGSELKNERRYPLRHGQRLRLAADVEAEVRLFPDRAQSSPGDTTGRES